MKKQPILIPDPRLVTLTTLSRCDVSAAKEKAALEKELAPVKRDEDDFDRIKRVLANIDIAGELVAAQENGLSVIKLDLEDRSYESRYLNPSSAISKEVISYLNAQIPEGSPIQRVDYLRDDSANKTTESGAAGLIATNLLPVIFSYSYEATVLYVFFDQALFGGYLAEAYYLLANTVSLGAIGVGIAARKTNADVEPNSLIIKFRNPDKSFTNFLSGALSKLSQGVTEAKSKLYASLRPSEPTYAQLREKFITDFQTTVQGIVDQSLKLGTKTEKKGLEFSIDVERLAELGSKQITLIQNRVSMRRDHHEIKSLLSLQDLLNGLKEANDMKTLRQEDLDSVHREFSVATQKVEANVRRGEKAVLTASLIGVNVELPSPH
ncbi:MAG: hypothetical protein AAGB32_05095 [Pseudomonadota bacterium]